MALVQRRYEADRSASRYRNEVGFFHGSGVICAPWNRLAYKSVDSRGPHDDWQIGNWRSNPQTGGCKTLSAMAQRIALELKLRIVAESSMSFWRELQRFLGGTPAPFIHASQPKVLLTQNCVDTIRVGLDPEMRKGHEGIVYLLGRTDGAMALAVTVFKPEALTSRGSFSVDARAMAACVGAAPRYELQVVGQLHSHPGEAYHSDGDVGGARIRYPGYVSIVLPNYGRLPPSF